MNSLKFLIYTLGRIGMVIVSIITGVFFGNIVFPALASIVPKSLNNVSDFITNKNTQSFVAWLIMLVILVLVFYDDGKKHTAYDIWSSVNIAITTILMWLVYFIPAIFRDSFYSSGQGEFFYNALYFPFKWISDGAGIDYLFSVAIGFGFMIALVFFTYVLSYKLYLKKHSAAFKIN